MKREEQAKKRAASRLKKKAAAQLSAHSQTVKFSPVRWQGSISSSEVASLHSPRTTDGKGGNNSLSSSPRLTRGSDETSGEEPPDLSTKLRQAPCVGRVFSLTYPSGGTGVESKGDGTAYAKWPNGSYAINREHDRIFSSYSSGKTAIMFDSSGNGSIYYPNGSTALSMSPHDCLLFKKVTGGNAKGKFDIVPLTASSGMSRITLNPGLGVDFCPSPLRIEVFFKSKNVHCKFVAPGTEGGDVVVEIKKKADLFGTKDRPKKKEKVEVSMEHGELLSAIQMAVAAL